MGSEMEAQSARQELGLEWLWLKAVSLPLVELVELTPWTALMSGSPSQMGGLSERTRRSQQQCTASQQSLSPLRISVLPTNISHKCSTAASSDLYLYSTLLPTLSFYNTC